MAAVQVLVGLPSALGDIEADIVLFENEHAMKW